MYAENLPEGNVPMASADEDILLVLLAGCCI